jgi:hypothetical protein
MKTDKVSRAIIKNIPAWLLRLPEGYYSYTECYDEKSIVNPLVCGCVSRHLYIYYLHKIYCDREPLIARNKKFYYWPGYENLNVPHKVVPDELRNQPAGKVGIGIFKGVDKTMQWMWLDKFCEYISPGDYRWMGIESFEKEMLTKARACINSSISKEKYPYLLVEIKRRSEVRYGKHFVKDRKKQSACERVTKVEWWDSQKETHKDKRRSS